MFVNSLASRRLAPRALEKAFFPAVRVGSTFGTKTLDLETPDRTRTAGTALPGKGYT